MAETALDRAQAVQTAAQATADKDPEVQRLAMRAVVPAPTPADTGKLWMALVVGLLVLLALALGGVIYLLADGDADTEPDIALTAFTALLTGLIGLFAPNPTGSKSDGE